MVTVNKKIVKKCIIENWCPENDYAHLRPISFNEESYNCIDDAINHLKKYGDVYWMIYDIGDKKDFLFYIPEIQRKFYIRYI